MVPRLKFSRRFKTATDWKTESGAALNRRDFLCERCRRHRAGKRKWNGRKERKERKKSGEQRMTLAGWVRPESRFDSMKFLAPVRVFCGHSSWGFRARARAGEKRGQSHARA